MSARIAALMEERKKLERDLSEARRSWRWAAAWSASAGAGANGVRVVGDVKLMARAIEGVEMKDLKSLADDGKLGARLRSCRHCRRHRRRQGYGVVVGVTQDLVTRYKRSRHGARGVGGAWPARAVAGAPDMAQAGGPDGSKAEAALEAIEKAMGSA